MVIQRFSATQFAAKAGVISKAEKAKTTVQTRLDKNEWFMAALTSQRSALFDGENHATSWKSCELAFYDTSPK